MSLINDKQEIFGQIAALKTLNDGFPSFLLSNSVPSINNKQDALNFLVDLLKSLVGYEKLKDSIIDLLTYELDNIEIEVKKTLKLNIKKFINCNSNPKIPDFLKHEKVIPSSTGINLEVKKIDLIDLMHIEPTSEVGHMFYDDASSGLKSTDFNTFLYNLIQDGNQQDWGNNSVNPILSFKFLQNGTINNIVNVKASEYYSTTINNKSINDLNSDYIDSIKLFASDKVISNIIDSLFGTISSLIKKDIKTLTKEEEINSIIDKLINANDDQLIDDSYFEFSDLEIYNHQETASNRKNGIRKLITCNEIESTILLETLSGITSIASAIFLLPSLNNPCGAPASLCLDIILAAMTLEFNPGLSCEPEIINGDGIGSSGGFPIVKIALIADVILLISIFYNLLFIDLIVLVLFSLIPLIFSLVLLIISLIFSCDAPSKLSICAFLLLARSVRFFIVSEAIKIVISFNTNFNK